MVARKTTTLSEINLLFIRNNVVMCIYVVRAKSGTFSIAKAAQMFSTHIILHPTNIFMQLNLFAQNSGLCYQITINEGFVKKKCLPTDNEIT